MKLVTKQIEKKLKPLYTYESDKPENVPVAVKFFNPCGAGTWYITEWDGKDLMFGLCSIQVPELGYVRLSEIMNCRLPFGLTIERDLHWRGTLAEAMEIEKYPYHKKPASEPAFESGLNKNPFVKGASN